MNKRLTHNLTSAYIEAANRLNSKRSRKRIVAYVESYDDVFFWRTVLSRYENSTRYFEVMLPSHTTLERGKKSVLMNELGDRLGECMIACVDADYDYLMNGATPTSHTVISNPYVLHTYAYAIESYQCFAPSLHNVCVMVTLNDHSIFDFEDYMRQLSEAIFPLFVWSIWHYRRSIYGQFTITDLNRIVELGGFAVFNDKEKQTFLRKLAKERGIILFTDPDGAGFVIRNRVKGNIPEGRVLQAYVPDIYGKEKRKRKGGKEGKLGVEGMKPEILLDALRRAGATIDEESTVKGKSITKADLYDLGLIGPDSVEKRKALCKRLELPEHLSANALVDVLNLLMSREELEKLFQ